MSNVAKKTLEDFIKESVPQGDGHSGYLVDLGTISLAEKDDGTSTSWVHALSLGEFKHPWYGKLNFTESRIKRFANNVVNKVRGVDLAIDYSHHSEGEAAGWVQTADARPDGLWILVEWTEEATKAIKGKKYRYFSSDFADEWEDSHGKKHEDVLFGGGLTNRPFLKNLAPVNLSEFFQEDDTEKGEEDEPMKELLKALGLAEDASEDDALEALKKLQEAPPQEDPPKEDDKLTTLAETHPEVKVLMDQVAELQSAQRLTEAKALVDEWSGNSTKKFALPEAVTGDIQDILIAASPQIKEKLNTVFSHIIENGVVKLGETGKRRVEETPDPKGTAASRFDAEVKKLMDADDKLSFGDAVSQASMDNEELYTEYRREAIAGAIVEEVPGEEVDD